MEFDHSESSSAIDLSLLCEAPYVEAVFSKIEGNAGERYWRDRRDGKQQRQQQQQQRQRQCTTRCRCCCGCRAKWGETARVPGGRSRADSSSAGLYAG